jgi:hypothetical protein
MSAQTNEIIAALDAVQAEQFGGDDVERLKVRAAARRLLSRVESPYERAWGFCFEHAAVYSALQTFIDLGLWKAWTNLGGGEKTVDELVAMTKPTIATNLARTFGLWYILLIFVLTKLFPGRFLRLLAAFYVVEETGVDIFKPTPFSLAIGDESTKVRASLQAALVEPINILMQRLSSYPC